MAWPIRGVGLGLPSAHLSLLPTPEPTGCWLAPKFPLRGLRESLHWEGIRLSLRPAHFSPSRGSIQECCGQNSTKTGKGVNSTNTARSPGSGHSQGRVSACEVRAGGRLHNHGAVGTDTQQGGCTSVRAWLWVGAMPGLWTGIRSFTGWIEIIKEGSSQL